VTSPFSTSATKESKFLKLPINLNSTCWLNPCEDKAESKFGVGVGFFDWGWGGGGGKLKNLATLDWKRFLV